MLMTILNLRDLITPMKKIEDLLNNLG